MSDEQLSFTSQMVDLTDEERIDRGRELANLLREADLLEAQHAEQKKGMAEERKGLEARIAKLADVVRSGKEERAMTSAPLSDDEPGAETAELAE